jgi:aminoglycoside 6'-N-acetyltransferase
MTDDDVQPLTDILSQREVARWWGQYDVSRVRTELAEGGDTVVYVIEVDLPEDDDLGTPGTIGSIQYFEEPARDYRHAGIDLFVSSVRHGEGIGSDSIRTMARHLVHDRGHHRLVIDPHVDNEAAIKCYQNVGFRKVGLMRAYERGLDGDWHDCLMLEMLKDELV